MNESSGPNKTLVIIIVIVLLGLVAGGGYLLTKPSDTQDDTTSSQTSDKAESKSLSTQNQNTATNSGTYVDGTYEATGSYISPGGREAIKVSLTISGNKVTDSTVTSEAKNPTAKGYQADFISGYKTSVEGKSVDEIKLDRVAGSSLTPNGFEDALEQIKKDATA
jgi:uncharacterized protein with FMN-binding domain